MKFRIVSIEPTDHRLGLSLKAPKDKTEKKEKKEEKEAVTEEVKA